jgi:hypothetical protein
MTDLPVVPWLLIEFHLPPMLQAALDGSVQQTHWLHLIATALMAFVWLAVGVILFARRGWQ